MFDIEKVKLQLGETSCQGSLKGNLMLIEFLITIFESLARNRVGNSNASLERISDFDQNDQNIFFEMHRRWPDVVKACPSNVLELDRSITDSNVEQALNMLGIKVRNSPYSKTEREKDSFIIRLQICAEPPLRFISAYYLFGC